MLNTTSFSWSCASACTLELPLMVKHHNHRMPLITMLATSKSTAIGLKSMGADVGEFSVRRSMDEIKTCENDVVITTANTMMPKGSILA